jgi:ketosteroid isomerase-like protein
MEVVNRWRAANFERPAVDEVLADDVEWIVPKGGGVTTVRGIDAVLEWYASGGVAEEAPPPEGVEVSDERGELQDFGEGRVGSLNRVVYTRTDSGEVVDEKLARLVYTVRGGKIVRYEIESLDDA